MLLRLISVAATTAGIDRDRGVGMWVAFFAAAIALGGAVMNFTRSGGKFSDLTDMDKMRGAFKGGSDEGRHLRLLRPARPLPRRRPPRLWTSPSSDRATG